LESNLLNRTLYTWHFRYRSFPVQTNMP